MELAVTITSAKNQPPQWERESYEVVIPENTTRDASVLVRLFVCSSQAAEELNIVYLLKCSELL